MNSVYSPGTQFEPLSRPWTTMALSLLAHAAAAAAVFAVGAVTASVVAPARVPDRLTFVRVAPPPPVRVPVRLPPPPVARVVTVVEPPPIRRPVPALPEPVVARTEPTPPVPEARRPQPVVPEPSKPVPQVSVGSFAAAGNSVRAVETARPVQPAGFDTAEARAPQIQSAAAAVGAFERAAGAARPGTDRPNIVGDAGFGAGVSTGRGRGGAGGVVTSGGFGSANGGASHGSRPPQNVKATDFDARAVPQAAAQPARPVRTETPLEILSKPTPVYSDEARALRIEGEVLLEVEFTAAGETRVLRVVRGLGHGLDEAAMRAVQSIRFKPAQRSGEPIDFRTTVNIVFRLA